MVLVLASLVLTFGVCHSVDEEDTGPTAGVSDFVARTISCSHADAGHDVVESTHRQIPVA